MKNSLITGVLVVTLIFAIFQSFQISAIKNDLGIGGETIKASSSGETYDEMMARMHPDQVKTESGKQQTRYSAPQSQQMVGGC